MNKLDDLKKLALQIYNATNEGENTAERVGNMFLNLIEQLANYDIESLGKYFLRKDINDTANGILTFKALQKFVFGIVSDAFVSGFDGSGMCLKKDGNGDWCLEVDRGLFRKSVTFVELIIQSLKHVGGQILLSPASMKCIKVEETDDTYKCYFNNDGSLSNEFAVDDLARRQTFNKTDNAYYWRAVVAVGDDYIELSKTDCDANSTIPQAGDDIVQLGNPFDVTRQNALILSAHGADSPCLKMYKGIDSYSLDGKELITISPSGVKINAAFFEFTSGISVKDYIDSSSSEAIKKAVENSIDKADLAIEAAQKESKNYTDSAKAELSKTIDDLNKTKANLADTYTKSQADGKISDSEKAAIAASQKALDAKAEELQIVIDALEDGQITDEERQKIDDAKSKADKAEEDAANAQEAADKANSDLADYKSKTDAAISDANDAISAAQTVSEGYTDAAKTEINKSIDAINKAKANLADIYTKSQTDGKISDSESNAIKAAQDALDAQSELLDTTLKAYADGVVSDEEKRAIKDATDKANSAKSAAIDAAAKDATSKANEAVSNAISNAKEYTDSQITLTNNAISLKVNVTDYDSDMSDINKKIDSIQVFSDVEYNVSSSNTIANGVWSSESPVWFVGKYIWMRTKLTKNGVVSYKPSEAGVNIQGAKGNNGDTGNGISSVTTEFYLSTSKDTQEGSSWVTISPNWESGKYLWTRSKIIYTNSSTPVYVGLTCSSEWEATNILKENLLSTGIDIEKRKITLTADETTVQTNTGKKIAAFTTDENGNPILNTECIDTDKLKVNILSTPFINITPSNILDYFEFKNNVYTVKGYLLNYYFYNNGYDWKVDLSISNIQAEEGQTTCIIFGYGVYSTNTYICNLSQCTWNNKLYSNMAYTFQCVQKFLGGTGAWALVSAQPYSNVESLPKSNNVIEDLAARSTSDGFSLVPYIFIVSSDNTKWYRKWNNGWLECGGVVTGSWGKAEVTFPYKFSIEPISVGVVLAASTTFGYGTGYYSLTTSGMKLIGHKDWSTVYFRWEARGWWK